MKPFLAFDPSQHINGSTLDTKGVNTNEQLMMYNDSIYGLLLTFPDNSQEIIPPLWNKDFIIPSVPMGVIKWSIYNQLAITNNPISSVYGVLYEPGEHVASVNASMQRAVVTTNPGGLQVSSWVNDGNPAGTTVGECSVSGDSQSAVKLLNNGQLTLGTTLNPGNLTLNGVLNIQADTAHVKTINGATSGTATATLIFTGAYTKIIVELINFKNGSGSAQNLVLPVAFTRRVWGICYDFPGFVMMLSASAQTETIITGFPTATSPGSEVPTTTPNGYTLFEVRGGLDTIQFGAGEANTHTALMELTGV